MNPGLGEVVIKVSAGRGVSVGTARKEDKGGDGGFDMAGSMGLYTGDGAFWGKRRGGALDLDGMRHVLVSEGIY